MGEDNENPEVPTWGVEFPEEDFSDIDLKILRIIEKREKCIKEQRIRDILIEDEDEE